MNVRRTAHCGTFGVAPDAVAAAGTDDVGVLPPVGNSLVVAEGAVGSVGEVGIADSLAVVGTIEALAVVGTIEGLVGPDGTDSSIAADGMIAPPVVMAIVGVTVSVLVVMT